MTSTMLAGWTSTPPDRPGFYLCVEPGSLPYLFEWTEVHQRLRGFWVYASEVLRYYTWGPEFRAPTRSSQ